MKTYLLIFNSKYGSRDDVQAKLDALSEIDYWYTCFSECFFITSRLSAKELTKLLNPSGSKDGRFLVIAVEGTDRQGMLPKAAWHVLRYPENPELEMEQ